MRLPADQYEPCDKKPDNYEFSGPQWLVRQLGAYLCHLQYKKELGKTSPDEDCQITELDQYLKSDRSDPEVMHRKFCPWEYS